MSAAVSIRFRLWLTVLAALAAVFALAVLPRLRVETDLLDLLPRTRADSELADAQAKFADASARKTLFLVGHSTPDTASRAAGAFAEALSQSGTFATVRAQWGAQADAAADSYDEHRFVLLAGSVRKWLAAQEPEKLERAALASLYSPLAFARPGDVVTDPLGLGAGYLLEQMPSAGAARLDGGQLVVDDGDSTFVLVLAETAGSPFAVELQQRAGAAIATATERARQTAGAQVSVLVSGTLPHAAAATQSARSEVSLFSSIATAAVLALLLALFHSWRALALGLLALASGACAGITATHFAFGQLHLIALVFGSSLIGVAIDYSMHFLSDQFRTADWTPAAALGHVARPILIGMGATLIGFGGLLFLPFPGLRQMAVIALAGLPVACGTVLCLYPVLAGQRATTLPSWCARALSWLETHTREALGSRTLRILAVPMLVLFLIGLGRTQFADDVRSLQPRFEATARAERRVRELLQDSTETALFVVTAPDPETLLEAEERLTDELDRLVAAGRLASFRAVSRSLPSVARQRANHALLGRYVYSADGVLPRVMRKIGFDESAIAAELASFPRAPQVLESAEWLAHPASAPWRDLWLGEERGTFASIVSLGGAHDLADISVLARGLPHVRFVDRVQDISIALAQYRRAVGWLLAGAYTLLLVVLSLRYGSTAPVLLLPPLGATGIALGALGWFGIPITLFTVLALLLMLAMGIDYAIFLREARAERRTALLAVTLSALTTMLSFGLLVLSATPFIRAIGLTLAIGIAGCWLFAVMSDRLTIEGTRVAPAPRVG